MDETQIGKLGNRMRDVYGDVGQKAQRRENVR